MAPSSRPVKIKGSVREISSSEISESREALRRKPPNRANATIEAAAIDEILPVAAEFSPADSRYLAF